MTKLAKIFVNGRSQAVRLPQEFRFSGTQVRVTRHGRGCCSAVARPRLVDLWFLARQDRAHRTLGEPRCIRSVQPCDRTLLDFFLRTS